jgi:hypothetical protein
VEDDENKGVEQEAIPPDKPIAPKRKPAVKVPRPSMELADALDDIVSHVRETTLRPLQGFVAAYALKMTSVFDELMTAVDEGDKKTKKVKKKP